MAVLKRKRVAGDAPPRATDKETAADKPIDGAALYVCWCGWADDRWACTTGEEVRGTDGRLRAHPEFYVLADTPQGEWPSVFDRVVLEAEQRAAEEAESNRIRSVALAPERTPTRLRLVRDIVVSRPGGRVATVEAGSEAYEGDELVAATGRPNWEPVK